MIALRARPSVARAAAVLCAALLVSCCFIHAGARAQSNQTPGATPVEPPAPAAPPTAVGPPTPLLPFDPTPRRSTGTEPGGATPQVRGIEIDRLSEMDPDSIGVLDPGQGGFGEALWRNSDRTQIESLLLRLPERLTSITLRDLASRLLLSAAEPPKHDDESDPAAGEETAQAPATDFLALRIDRLMALGEIGGLSRLLQAVPRRFDDKRILRGRVESLVLSDDLGGACREVRNAVTLYHALPYWQKALLVCQLAQGERDQAELGLALMRERGTLDDPGFFALIDVMTGGDAVVPTATAMEPLNFAALQAVGWQPPPDLVNRAPPGLLAAIAKSPKVPLEERAVAAELALATGALAPPLLAELYGSFRFDPAQFDGSAERVAPIGPAQRALLVQRVTRSGDVQARAHRIRVALETAAETGLYQSQLQVLLPELTRLPVTPDLAWFAETASRAFFAAGGFERARAWYSLARAQAGRNSLASAAAARLWPYLRLSGAPTLSQTNELSTWRQARRDLDEPVLARGEALLRAALQALDRNGSVPLGNLAAQAAVAARSLPESDLLLDLREASESGRRGESVLLVLVILGEEGLEATSPATLNAALAALQRVDFGLEASALAIEAAIANGV